MSRVREWIGGAKRVTHRVMVAAGLSVPDYAVFEKRGEEIYDELHDKPGHGLLSEIKECFFAAIRAAKEAGFTRQAARLESRLDHIVTVHRKHFS